MCLLMGDVTMHHRVAQPWLKDRIWIIYVFTENLRSGFSVLFVKTVRVKAGLK